MTTMKVSAERGRVRTDADKFRRYLPIAISFDTRAWILETEIEDSWEESVKEQWQQNRRALREHLIHQYGAERYDRKVRDFADLGRAPWTVIAPHVETLRDSRTAFTAGAYYSSLLGAAGLGERILNDLVLQLRPEFGDHPATRRVEKKQSFDDWRVMADVLRSWDVLDAETARICKKFGKLRQAVVHFRPDRSLAVRSSALEAQAHLRHLINHVFSPIGGPPRFIADTAGQSFISLGAEADPVVKHYFIPNSVLVSPDFDFSGAREAVIDEDDYGSMHGVTELTDEEFARRFRERDVPSSGGKVSGMPGE
jgi:hypothetical protein